jgi:predicted transcriptional regulator
MNVRVTINLDEDLKRQARELARQTESTLSQLVEDALREYLD